MSKTEGICSYPVLECTLNAQKCTHCCHYAKSALRMTESESPYLCLLNFFGEEMLYSYCHHCCVKMYQCI